ncbi:MAG: hypothetical protein A2X64_06170 [Ignavibacteria bacterium GWF2_33_9]|nr:MAG: hypothetical protein A2X64_06170 [Ignavibacteria bacterium GWF2_33_9]
MPDTRFSGQKEVRNNYGLKIIETAEEYNHSVDLDSNCRMINLDGYIQDLKFDIKYATKSNFTKQAVYDEAKAFVRLPVAKALKLVQSELSGNNLGLIIFDAYRPYSITLKFWEMYRDTNFVAAPWTGSRHNRGCAVDVSLYNLKTGIELNMPTIFDDFSEKASWDYPNLSDEKLANRTMLINIMGKYGFTVYPTEWWHFDFAGYEKYGLMDIPFSYLEEN